MLGKLKLLIVVFILALVTLIYGNDNERKSFFIKYREAIRENRTYVKPIMTVKVEYVDTKTIIDENGSFVEIIDFKEKIYYTTFSGALQLLEQDGITEDRVRSIIKVNTIE